MILLKNFSYWTLFKAMFTTSAFTLGGGLVFLPILKNKFVDNLGWIKEKDIYDMFSIVQSVPGIIAINVSLLLGKKVAGNKGMIVSMFGIILPPFIILYIISYFYNSLISNLIIKDLLFALQAAVAALIISVALSMFNSIIKEDKIYNIILFSIVLILILFFNINIFYIIMASIILAIIRFFMKAGEK